MTRHDPLTARLIPVALIAAMALAGCGETPGGQAAGAASPSASPSTSPTPSPTPPPATTPAAAPVSTAPAPKWAPCDRGRKDYEGGCQTDFYADSCDASYYSQQFGDLLDAYIENKLQVDPNRLKDCPQFLPTWRKALTGFRDGSYQVGAEVKPGTYETTSHLNGGQVHGCYWERGGANGDIIANNFVTAAKKVRVMIQSTDEMFTSRGCGNWVRL